MPGKILLFAAGILFAATATAQETDRVIPLTHTDTHGIQQIANLELLLVEWTQLQPDYLNMVLQIQQDPRWRNIRVLVLNAPWAPPADSGRRDAHAFLRPGCSIEELRSALAAMGLKPKGGDCCTG